jgi:CRP/FNR family transcriptional regulator
MSPTDLSWLAQRMRFDRYERDAVIFFQGDDSDRIWFVHQGRVKIVYHDEDGREVILEMIPQGEAFGGGVLLFPQNPATAVAMEESSIASFPLEIYTQFLSQQPGVVIKLLRMLGARHLSMMNMQIMAGERVERRMAHILFKLAARVGRPDPEGTLITIPLSRQDLADMSCTTLETAIRTLSRFTKDELITTRRGGYIVITNSDALEELTH